MRVQELIEQVGTVGTIGTTTMPATPAGSVNTGQVTGNVQALTDPKMQASMLAKQKQEKDKQRQAIMAQIAALNKQLSDLSKM
jgi:hypothetical protein